MVTTAAQAYDPGAFEPVAVAVDVVALTIRHDALHVLLVDRGEAPYQGRRALPGGFVRTPRDAAGQPLGESLDQAALRELAEETGLVPGRSPLQRVHLEQLASYGAPERDPRMRVISVAYLAFGPAMPDPVAGGDAAAAAWVPVTEAGRLAFDHDEILADGLDRARAKLEYTPLAAAFCDEELTVADLRRVYEAVWGVGLDPRNFHRKVTGTPGFLQPIGRAARVGPEGGRPAALYRRGPATALHPPMLRPRPE